MGDGVTTGRGESRVAGAKQDAEDQLSTCDSWKGRVGVVRRLIVAVSTGSRERVASCGRFVSALFAPPELIDLAREGLISVLPVGPSRGCHIDSH